MRWTSLCSCSLALSLVLAADVIATVPAFQQELSPVQSGAPAVIRYFGHNQSVDGNLLAVGAPYSVGSVENTPGTVFIYRRINGAWVYAQALQAPTPANGDGFGYGVTVVGNNVMVGAPFGNSQRGSSHLYIFSDGALQLVQSFPAPMDVANGGWFGLRSSINNGWMAIGAPGTVGAVYMYRYDVAGEAWVAHSKLTSDFAQAQRFGFSLALSGNHLVVGSPQDLIVSNQGNAYAFSRTGNGSAAVWSQAQRFRMSFDAGAAAPQIFGLSLAMNSDATRLAVGSPQAGELGGGTAVIGAVFMFERSVGDWTQVARLDSPFSSRRNFGTAVSLVDDLVLAGDPQDVSTGLVRGAAFAFRRNSTGDWLPIQSWYRSSGIQGDNYGVSTAIAGDQFLVGSSTTDGSTAGTTDQGRLFVHQLDMLFQDGFE